MSETRRPIKVATWNVNGIRARAAQVREWLERDRPDVVCLQELKAERAQIPPEVEHPDYHGYWHGLKGYSGVALLVGRGQYAAHPVYSHPPFDLESRIVQVELGDLVIASIYVPNGGKDYAAKLAFLTHLTDWARRVQAEGRELLLCGDMNIARTDQDVHPRERKPDVVGQRPDERALFETLFGTGLVDLGRTFDPDNPGLFTWWAPWRNLRARNIGWRLDYLLASPTVAARAQSCVVQPEVGTSDHAPVVAMTG
jgi:exodeoxyribonuclease III